MRKSLVSVLLVTALLVSIVGAIEPSSAALAFCTTTKPGAGVCTYTAKGNTGGICALVSGSWEVRDLTTGKVVQKGPGVKCGPKTLKSGHRYRAKILAGTGWLGVGNL